MISSYLFTFVSSVKILESNAYKGQLNSEWIYVVIVSPKMQIKNYKDFCPTVKTRIVALFLGDFLVSLGSFLATISVCLVG